MRERVLLLMHMQRRRGAKHDIGNITQKYYTESDKTIAHSIVFERGLDSSKKFLSSKNKSKNHENPNSVLFGKGGGVYLLSLNFTVYFLIFSSIFFFTSFQKIRGDSMIILLFIYMFIN